jgi:hypothetical protein
LICVPLATTLYNLKTYEKICRRLADFVGAKMVPAFTEVQPNEIYACESHGLELGTI